MAESRTFLRFASPNEHRTISREDAGFYNAVVVGATYEVESQEIDVKRPEIFIAPLKECVLKYPFLSVVVRDKDTDKPGYEAVASIDLLEHVCILPESLEVDEVRAIEKILPASFDRPWPADIPPWRIVVLPIPRTDKTSTAVASRCFIAFSFSHTLGDGNVGLTFHRTFQAAWTESITSPKSNTSSPSLCLPPRPLPDPFDTPSRLPVSWKFLLAPLAAEYLPNYLKHILGLRASTSSIDEGTWTGAPMFFDAARAATAEGCSRVRMLEIEAPLVAAALAASRAHEAKLTATLHQIIVCALSRALPSEEITNFVSGTAVDMRASIGVPAGEWGLYVSGHYEVRSRIPLDPISDLSEGVEKGQALSEEMWESARSITRNLAACSTRLQDQAIGLLRYAPSIRGWTLGKIGGRRDASYEVSNLLAFSPSPSPAAPRVGKGKCRITKVVFAHPGNALSAPLVFSVVSLKGGSLVVAVSWQVGALGLNKVEDEAGFVEGVCQGVRAGFEGLRDN